MEKLKRNEPDWKLVVAIALVLPTTLYVSLDNARQLGSRVQNTGQISVFIHPRAKDNAIQALSKRLLTKPEVTAVTLVTPEEALAEFQLHSGFGDIVESLDANPLPTVLLIEPALNTVQPKALALQFV